MAFEELKARQGEVWGSAPFERVAESIADVHDQLVEALAPQPGERWLDVATGTGAVAQRAARAGATVTGQDLASALIDTAKRLAGEEGLEIDFSVGDAENLAFADASFDIVSSAFGVMFAPDQATAARELARVTRPGGRIGLACWTPEGSIGAFFKLSAGFQPPLPEGAGIPVAWGRPERQEELLGDAFELEIVEHTSTYAEDETPEQVWELFTSAFGPVKTLAAMLDDERRKEFHDAFVEFIGQYATNGGLSWPREYLLTIGTRKAD